MEGEVEKYTLAERTWHEHEAASQAREEDPGPGVGAGGDQVAFVQEGPVRARQGVGGLGAERCRGLQGQGYPLSRDQCAVAPQAQRFTFRGGEATACRPSRC